MGLIGYEIIQSRVWVDPTNPTPPDLNYKLSFPITVFDAVRRDMMNEDSETLTQVIEKIGNELKSRQSIIPAKPANYLMTYAGIAGQVGSIQISKEIPWNSEDQSNNRIPTEKAVGDLIKKLGIDPNDPNSQCNVRWSDVIGRPTIYNSFGNDDNGIICQTKITDEFRNVNNKIEDINESYGILCNSLKDKLDHHTSNMNNPHNITIQLIGAASADVLKNHLEEDNPHNITANTIGLGKVDNTSDKDKPISMATQEAIDIINNLINNMSDDIGELNFIVNVTYNRNTGELNLIYRDGTIVKLDSPIEESIRDVMYDSTTKEIVLINNAGIEYRIDVSELYIRYIGYEGTNITVEVDGNQITGIQTIKAYINPKSIKAIDISDDAIINRTIKDKSITSNKIDDSAIINSKYADRSITNEKIVKHTINNENLADRIIDGRTLCPSIEAYRILATVTANSNPVWTKIYSEMIADDVIKDFHISKYAVTHDKIAENAIGTLNIEDLSVVTEKIADRSITTEKILNESITSDKLANDLIFKGTPLIENTPNSDSNNNEIVNSKWVKDFAKNDLIINTSNIAKRAVTGEKLFSSNTKNRVLAVLKANKDPEWSLINKHMMDIDSIDTDNIIDRSVTASKLSDKSIESRHLTKHAIQINHIGESAVISDNIFTSHEANRVLASISENGHPIYTQVNQSMMAPNSVGTMQLIDGSIALSKIESSDVSQQVIAVGLKGSTPVWTKVMQQMISDRAVNGSKLFTSDENHMILGVDRLGTNPTWMKLLGEMIADHTIKSINIDENAINNFNIADNAVESRNIRERSVHYDHIMPGEIRPDLIESSPIPGRVIAVAGLPYSTPMWMQVNTSMLEDKAVTKEKIYQSDYPYHVLGATQAGVPPEYLMITHQFIVDGTIIPEKLVRDFVLFGTPELTVSPPDDSDDFSLANTNWVRKVIDAKIVDFFTNPEMPDWMPKFNADYIPEHAIDGTKLFTHPHGPRVLGITEANDDVEFILIENNLIVDGAVTNNKIERNVCLLGSPEIEVRPSAYASDSNGLGCQIPDCQWVIDRINDVIGGTTIPGSGSNVTQTSIPEGSITGYHIQNRTITGDKLFTSSTANRLIGILNSNTSPVYLQANNEMIENRAIDGRTLFTSSENNRILGVINANSNAIWTQINSGMIGDKVIKNNHIADRTINENHINSGAITNRTLANMPIIDETRIFDHAITKEKLKDNSVSTEKLIDSSITNEKIKDNTISGKKLSKDIVLPKNSSIQNSRDYEQKSIRNITISPNRPKGGKSGDIWFKFE